jgi:fumarate reductase subunit C
VAIIFVSHNLHAISHVCSRAITLEKGRVIHDGDTEGAIDVYRASLIKLNESIEEVLRPGTGEIKILGLEILDEAGAPQNEFGVGDFVRFRMHYLAREPVDNPVFNVTISILYSEPVTGMRTDVDGLQPGPIAGEGYVDITIPNLNLLPNVYTLDAVLLHEDGYTYFDRVNKIAHLKVRGGLLINGTAYLPHAWDLGKPDDSTPVLNQISPLGITKKTG